jgi:dTDP-4-dehydrorhamnose 3,5-epimerase
MRLQIDSRPLPDVAVIIPEVFEDARGCFMETYRADQFGELGLPVDFVQDNCSRSVQGVLRGLHFQWDPPMGKLMRVAAGRAFLVAVDIRPGSPDCGRWAGVECSSENRRQLWAPAGFARGFCVLSEIAEIQYKCTGLYNGRAEAAIRWNDPAIRIPWPVRNPVLSEKDKQANTLADWLASPDADRLRYHADPRCSA